MSQISENPEFENPDPAPPPKWPIAVLVVALAAVALWMLFGGPSQRPGLRFGTRHAAVGSAKLELSAPALDGLGADLSPESTKGKVVLINFWGPWCPPCREEFPGVYQIYRKHRENKSFAMAFISCNGGKYPPRSLELAEDTRKFLNERGYKAPIYLDSTGVTTRDAEVQLKQNGFNFPTTVLVDREGIVQAVWVGFQEAFFDEIVESVDRELAR